jgi:hypothetical protein
MRIRVRWAWIPLAVTVAGVVYLSLVKLARYQAALREPHVAREAPKPFVPPPARAKREPEIITMPPEIEVMPVRPPASVLPEVQLPPLRRPANK